MNVNLRSETGAHLTFLKGLPLHLKGNIIPQATSCYSITEEGTVWLQELKTSHYILRYFLFFIKTTLTLFWQEKNEGLQSLINIKGRFEFRTGKLKPVLLTSKEFILLDAKDSKGSTNIAAGAPSALMNIYFLPTAYTDLFSLFPKLKSDLKKALTAPRLLLFAPRIARYTLHDNIQAIWHDKYLPILAKRYLQLRVETCLFTLLAQTYTRRDVPVVSTQELDMARHASEIILTNVKKHLTPAEIAAQLFCSVGWLKKAFSKVYGVGMFHFLRRKRMELAKEMLLKGDSLKVVAIEVGMKPRNFPKEFKIFFGYTVTEFKKGLS